MKKKSSGISRLRVLCAAALLSAAAVIIAYICKFLTFGSIRITFENIPIILSGIFFGPAVGFATGISADLVSTAISHYGFGGLNPLITLGAGSVGFVSGLMFNYATLKIKKDGVRIAVSVFSSHIVGNMIIKTVALMIYFSYPPILAFLRIPTYIAISVIEFILILMLCKNNGVIKAVNKLRS